MAFPSHVSEASVIVGLGQRGFDALRPYPNLTSARGTTTLRSNPVKDGKARVEHWSMVSEPFKRTRSFEPPFGRRLVRCFRQCFLLFASKGFDLPLLKSISLQQMFSYVLFLFSGPKRQIPSTGPRGPLVFHFSIIFPLPIWAFRGMVERPLVVARNGQLNQHGTFMGVCFFLLLVGIFLNKELQQ